MVHCIVQSVYCKPCPFRDHRAEIDESARARFDDAIRYVVATCVETALNLGIHQTIEERYSVRWTHWLRPVSEGGCFCNRTQVLSVDHSSAASYIAVGV